MLGPRVSQRWESLDQTSKDHRQVGSRYGVCWWGELTSWYRKLIEAGLEEFRRRHLRRCRVAVLA